MKEIHRQISVALLLVLLLALALLENNQPVLNKNIQSDEFNAKKDTPQVSKLRPTITKKKFQELNPEVEVEGIPLQNSKYVILGVTLPRSSFQVAYIFQAYLTAKIWSVKGFHPFILLTGTKKEWNEHSIGRFTDV